MVWGGAYTQFLVADNHCRFMAKMWHWMFDLGDGHRRIYGLFRGALSIVHVQCLFGRLVRLKTHTL